jgi:hypothetical protein
MALGVGMGASSWVHGGVIKVHFIFKAVDEIKRA